ASVQQALHGLQHRELVVDDGDELAPLRHEAMSELSPQDDNRAKVILRAGELSCHGRVRTIVLWCNTRTASPIGRRVGVSRASIPGGCHQALLPPGAASSPSRSAMETASASD